MLTSRVGLASIMLVPNLFSMRRGNSCAMPASVDTARVRAARERRRIILNVRGVGSVGCCAAAQQQGDEEGNADQCGQQAGGNLARRKGGTADEIGQRDQHGADRKSTRLTSSPYCASRMPSSA